MLNEISFGQSAPVWKVDSNVSIGLVSSIGGEDQEEQGEGRRERMTGCCIIAWRLIIVLKVTFSIAFVNSSIEKRQIASNRKLVFSGIYVLGMCVCVCMCVFMRARWTSGILNEILFKIPSSNSIEISEICTLKMDRFKI